MGYVLNKDWSEILAKNIDVDFKKSCLILSIMNMLQKQFILLKKKYLIV